MKMQQIIDEVKKGRTISQYPTGQYGYDSYFRWDDTGVVVKSKSLWAAQKRIDIPTPIRDKVVPYEYNGYPSNWVDNAHLYNRYRCKRK